MMCSCCIGRHGVTKGCAVQSFLERRTLHCPVDRHPARSYFASKPVLILVEVSPNTKFYENPSSGGGGGVESGQMDGHKLDGNWRF
jgi:hypothetical protein